MTFLCYEDILICPGIRDARHQSCSASTQSSQTRHARPKRTDFMGEKQIRIRQSPLNPPDCATTISRLITHGMNGRQIYPCSLASMFYWTIYKRGDTDGRTLMGRSHTILQQYGLTLDKAIFNDIFRINNKTVIYEQYSYGQNGLVDSLRAIFNDYRVYIRQQTLCPNAAAILTLF